MKDIVKLISRMTLEEKASLCSGLDLWHLKGIDRLGNSLDHDYRWSARVKKTARQQ